VHAVLDCLRLGNLGEHPGGSASRSTGDQPSRLRRPWKPMLANSLVASGSSGRPMAADQNRPTVRASETVERHASDLDSHAASLATRIRVGRRPPCRRVHERGRLPSH
jgi:hypothetical protein